jgi:hypothetical protein
MAFVALCVAIVAAFILGVAASAKRSGAAPKRVAGVGLGVAVWLGLCGVVVASGVVAAQPMPRLMIFFAIINIVSLAAALSPLGGWLAALPLPWLVGFQAFRLPLELILHSWAAQGTIPEAMTWTGSNYDIISGSVALLAAPWAGRSRAAAWIANLVGLALLINVARVVILTSPLPFAWSVQPPLQLVFHLPYALIAPVCVGGAIFGHVVLTRALLRRA